MRPVRTPVSEFVHKIKVMLNRIVHGYETIEFDRVRLATVDDVKQMILF